MKQEKIDFIFFYTIKETLTTITIMLAVKSVMNPNTTVMSVSVINKINLAHPQFGMTPMLHFTMIQTEKDILYKFLEEEYKYNHCIEPHSDIIMTNCSETTLNKFKNLYTAEGAKAIISAIVGQSLKAFMKL